ncbi:MAG: 3-hydroxyisobutyrate dehydrogenase [Neisseria sp.]|nr:3-hydroxyisobutyrate dehydrogenase [Neisseria sp.]
MERAIKHIAFIGLGNMGAPMAANLLQRGYAVSVVDLNRDAVAALVSQGAADGVSAVQAAAGADAVITMLPAGAHVKSVYFGNGDEQGVFDVLSEGTLAVDCSTIAVDDARTLAAAAAEKGIVFCDAPVSGGIAGAAAGTLSFMVGGDTGAFERALPLLQAMGKNIFYAGGHGAGQVAKICNNMLLGILMSGTAEALALGVKNGLDAAVLSDIMAKSSGSNWVLNVYNPYPGVMPNVPAARAYSGGFMSKLMLKDLRLATELAGNTPQDVPMGTKAAELYQHFAE